MCQTYYKITHLFDIGPEAFNPPPKVDSAIVKLIPFEQASQKIRDEACYARVIKHAFSQRRKTIRNTLKSFFNNEDFVTLDIDPEKRAQNLSVADYINLANYYQTNKNQ